MAWDIIPHDGWHFFEKDGTTLRDNSHDELVKTIEKYRIDNNLPIGNPEAELDKQICARQPNICGPGHKEEDQDAPQRLYGQPIKRRLIDRIAQWSANRYSRLGAVSHVSTEEAQRRSAVCAQCPKNLVEWRFNAIKDCAPCQERVEALDVQLFKIRAGSATVFDKRLGACSVLGHDNKTAVWLQEPHLRHRKYFIYETPKECWLRNLEPNT